MYLMGLVNSTFVARRPTDHVELIDLSLEKKEAQDRYNKEQNKALLTNGLPRSPRRHAPENQPADLCMEPLLPLTSASSDSSNGDKGTMSWDPSTGKKLEDASSRQLEMDQELSRGDNKQMERKEAGQTERKSRVAPKRLVSEGGVSTRVQRHPLEVIQEQEHSDDERAKLDRPARVLQHPLERIDEDLPKNQKPATRKERVSPSQQPGRKFVREAKVDVFKQPPKRERAKPRESRAPIRAPITKPSPKQSPKPRIPKPDCEIPKPETNDREKPSLASPVMEKMEGLASPEPPYLWKTKFPNLPKLAVSSVDNTEPLMEERELRYSSPKMTESDAQDELSFRVWERGSTPKRKSVSVSSDFQELDLAGIPHPKEEESVVENEKSNPEQLSPLRTFPQRAAPNHETRTCEEESIQCEYPSPSSFTCGLSPTSLFSDDDNIFSRFQPFPEFGEATTTTTFCKSPRSVLSREPDEVSHFASDSSKTRDGPRKFASSSAYHDESSDLESPAGLNRRSFSKFTNKEMELTTSEDDAEDARDDTMLVDENDAHDGVDVAELRYFQEAKYREPWLETESGVLDDADLEFLLPPETTSIPEDDSEIPEEVLAPTTSPETPSKPTKCQDHWIPCDNDTTPVPRPRSGLPRRHSRSSSFSKSNEKLHAPRPPKRSVKFAPELVRGPTPTPKPNQKPLRLPRPESPNPKDDDEHIYPSVKSWEVNEDIAVSPTSTPRRRWRRAPNPKPLPSEAAVDPSIPTSRRRRWRNSRLEEEGVAACSDRRRQMLPCAGRLFSWPQRLAFKVSRSQHAEASDDDDDESIAGMESFGRSARRDAQQMRLILKGSHKKFSDLTVADILHDSFQPDGRLNGKGEVEWQGLQVPHTLQEISRACGGPD